MSADRGGEKVIWVKKKRGASGQNIPYESYISVC